MDLTLSMAERFTDTGAPDGIGVTVEFRTDVFDPGTVEGLIERLRRVLQVMIADPDRRLSASTSSMSRNTRGSNGGATPLRWPTPSRRGVGAGGVRRAGG